MVVATLKRSSSELSSSLHKVFKIDDHMGIAISGLVSDGRSLCKYMRNECLNHKCGSPPVPPTALHMWDICCAVRYDISWQHPG